MMNIRELLKSKKFKNIAITVIEILIVAGLIFGGLMFVYNKINKEADITSGINNESKRTEEGSGDYLIQINKKKNAIIVYEYSKDKKEKNAIKIFRATVGLSLGKGKGKVSDKYTWMKTGGNWHKYNTKIGKSSYIQSAKYLDKYSYTLNTESYNRIGKKQKADKSVFLYANDANWIFAHCKKGTEIEIINGKDKDILPLEFNPKVELEKKCGWDPTDPDKNNPYLKVKNGKIVGGDSVVIVERGQSVDYLNNIIAKDSNGKNINNLLKFKGFNKDKVGTYKVKYSYKKEKLKFTQKFKVVDTVAPVISSSTKVFSYTVDSLDQDVLNSDKTVSAIESIARAHAYANEPGVKITAHCVEKSELEKDKTVTVAIKGQDPYGNVGGTSVLCKIYLKDIKTNPKGTGKKKYEKFRDDSTTKDKNKSKKKETNKK